MGPLLLNSHDKRAERLHQCPVSSLAFPLVFFLSVCSFVSHSNTRLIHFENLFVTVGAE